MVCMCPAESFVSCLQRGRWNKRRNLRSCSISTKMRKVHTHTHTKDTHSCIHVTPSDVVACIEAGLDGGIPRSRKQIAKQLVTQGLVSSRKELHKKGNKPAKVRDSQLT